MLKLLRRKVSLLNVINKFKQFCDNFEVGGNLHEWCDYYYIKPQHYNFLKH